MSPKILIADDDPSFLECLRLRLAESGYDVLTAKEGTEALRVIKTDKPAVVLLDLMMPQANGYAVCRAVRNDAALAGTKIIIVSAKSFKADMAMAKAAGADHYLVKPFDAKDLLALLTRIAGCSASPSTA